MKDRINRVKQYVSSHQNEIIVGAVTVTLGAIVGSKLKHKHTILTITPDELEHFLTDDVMTASYKIARRQSIHIIKIASRSS